MVRLSHSYPLVNSPLDFISLSVTVRTDLDRTGPIQVRPYPYIRSQFNYPTGQTDSHPASSARPTRQGFSQVDTRAGWSKDLVGRQRAPIGRIAWTGARKVPGGGQRAGAEPPSAGRARASRTGLGGHT